MQKAPRRSTPTVSVAALNKVRKLPIEQRAFAFLLTMGFLGAIFGAITTDVEIRACMKSWDCVTMNSTAQRIEGIKAGAYSGIAAAAVLSFPALFKDLGSR